MSERIEGSLNKACAACKHQRRKCHPGCVLARYFPAERAAQFEAVHRLFGVSNLMRFYNAASNEQRDHVIATMTFEAEARRNDPVLGCVAIIRDLNTRIDATRRELDATFAQIAFYRRQQQEQQEQQLHTQQLLLTVQQHQERLMRPMADMFSLLHPRQHFPLPPAMVDDKVVDVGRTKKTERSGTSHGPSLDEEAVRQFNPAAPPNPVVDLQPHMEGSSGLKGLEQLVQCGIQGRRDKEQGIDGLKAAAGAFSHSSFWKKSSISS